jgi:hypothetical protein
MLSPHRLESGKEMQPQMSFYLHIRHTFRQSFYSYVSKYVFNDLLQSSKNDIFAHMNEEQKDRHDMRHTSASCGHSRSFQRRRKSQAVNIRASVGKNNE